MLKSAGQGFFAIHSNGPSLTYGEKWMPAMKKEFETLMKDGGNFVARRNEIAHGVVLPLKRARSKRKIYALQPAPMEGKKHFYLLMFPLFAYSSKELDYYTEQFGKLRHAAGILNSRLRAYLREHQQASL